MMGMGMGGKRSVEKLEVFVSYHVLIREDKGRA